MFSKKNLKFFSYSMLFSLGYGFINPVFVKAEENKVNKYDEILYEEVNFMEDDTSLNSKFYPQKNENNSNLEKVFLKDIISLDAVKNGVDHNYLNSIYFISNNETLILVSEDVSNTYDVQLNVHNAIHEISDAKEKNIKKVTFQISPDSKIEVSFNNSDTKNQYVLLISTNNKELDIKLNSYLNQMSESPDTPEEIEPVEVPDPPEEIEPAEVPDTPEEIEPVEVPDTPEEIESVEAPDTIKESEKQTIEHTTPTARSFVLSNAKQSTHTITRVSKKGLYTVVAGDTLNNIANSFNVSLPQLKIYNNIPSNSNHISKGQVLAISREGVENRLPSSEKERLYKGGTNIFKSRQDFFNYIAPTAIQIANAFGEKKLYASVMIAQAAHETGFGTSGLSSVPYHNLSGLKGTYNGDYVKMWTGEFLKNYNNTGKDVYVYVLADFKKFPSYEESLKSYANLLRYGTSWNKNLYSGTWYENTNSYLDATAELTKNYATDPAYTIAVNKMIQDYDLTKYDNNDVFLTKKRVDYYGTVLSSNKGIYTKPHGMTNSILYTSYKYNNKAVHITEEATTQSGTFVKLVDIHTRHTLGWIRKADVNSYDNFISKKDVNYYGAVSNNNNGIYTKPKGMYNSILYTNYKYNDTIVHVTEEGITQSDTYVKLVDETTRATLGWLKKSDLVFYDTFLTKNTVNYTVTVLPNNEGIYTKPHGMQGSILYTSYKFNNKMVKVGEKATTQSGTFLKLIDLNTRATLGWIKETGVK